MPSYRRRRRREVPPVRVDLNGVLVPHVGPDGVTPEDLAAAAPELERVRSVLGVLRGEGQLGFADFEALREQMRAVHHLVAQLVGRFEAVVVFGAGASAVGARVLGAARRPGRIRRPRLVVADSIDPVVMDDLLRRLDLRRTLFNVVSQSGDAAETMSQFMVVRDRLLHELGAVDYREHVVVTTDAERGSLRQIVNDEGFRSLAVPRDAPGAFALLSPTGLFPAAMTGVDVEELLDGAAAMAERGLAATDPLADPTLAFAAALRLVAARGRARSLAIAPYSAALAPLAEWVSQLWGGQVPLIRHTDLVRHYDDGGFGDRVVVLLRVDEHPIVLEVPSAYRDLDDVGYLGGHAFGGILNAEQRAAEFLLARRGHPTATIALPALTAGTLGQVVYLFEATAAALAVLEGGEPTRAIDAVEARRTVGALLDRPGTDAERAELDGWWTRKDPRYIL